MGNENGQGVERAIGRLEGKVDSIVSDVRALRSSFEVLEAGRLSAVEKEVANLTTKMAIITASISVGISVVLSIIQFVFFK